MQKRTRRLTMRALEAFEAVSRHLSISRAADELGVTQSAVSHQLRQLSEEVGERLFVRSGRALVLTPAGQVMATNVQLAFAQIDRSVSAVTGANRSVVRLAICSSFAPGWISKRLGAFYSTNSGIDLQLRMYAKDPELTDQVADAFVTTYPKEPGFHSFLLQTEALVAVRSAAEQEPSAGRLPLITTTLDPRRMGDDWEAYCAAAGRDLSSLHTGTWLQVSHYVLAHELARRGLGMALVPDFLAEDDVATGRLRLVSDDKVFTGEDYHFCIKEARRKEKPLKIVSDWLRRQLQTARLSKSGVVGAH